MGIVAILYWLWLLAAVCALGYRVYGRATGQRRSILDFRRGDSSPAGETATTGEHAPEPPEAAPRHPIDALTEHPPADVHQPASVGGLDGGEIHPSVLAAMRTDEPPADANPEPEPTSGLFGAEAREAHDDVAVGTLAPLRETLTGIEMPCDLVPLTDLGPRAVREQHRERLVLMTSSAGAGEVAARLADELERIGLDVTSTGTASCVARRRDRAVEVRVHEFPDRVEVDGAPAFPSAPGGCVVVELLAA